jgi:hypothetical protein
MKITIITQLTIVVKRDGRVSHPPGRARARAKGSVLSVCTGATTGDSTRPTPDNPILRAHVRDERLGLPSCALVIVSFRNGNAETYEAGNPAVEWGFPGIMHARTPFRRSPGPACIAHMPVCEYLSIGFPSPIGGLEHLLIEE